MTDLSFRMCFRASGPDPAAARRAANLAAVAAAVREEAERKEATAARGWKEDETMKKRKQSLARENSKCENVKAIS